MIENTYFSSLYIPRKFQKIIKKKQLVVRMSLKIFKNHGFLVILKLHLISVEVLGCVNILKSGTNFTFFHHGKVWTIPGNPLGLYKKYSYFCEKYGLLCRKYHFFYHEQHFDKIRTSFYNFMSVKIYNIEFFLEEVPFWKRSLV